MVLPNTVRFHRVLRLPDVIPPEACCPGWQESLLLLAKLVGVLV